MEEESGIATNGYVAVEYTIDGNISVWENFLWRDHTEPCVLIQSHLPERIDLTTVQFLFSVLYFIVWLTALCGNICVIYVVTLKQVTLSNVRSVFILTLAISDIIMSLTSLPVTAISLFTRDWVFPHFICKCIGVFQGGSVFISSFTLSAIAVDRYILVRYPGNEIIDFARARAIVIAIWVLGYIFALPLGAFSSLVRFPPLCGSFCEEIWPDTNETGVSRMRKIYGVTVLVFQFVLPAVICSVSYLLIGRIINEQIEKRKKQEVLLEENQQRLDSRKSRSSRLMIAMVGGLVLAWLPMNLINLWRDFNDTGESQWYSVIFAGCHVIAMTSAAWNPIFYSWFNPQFRDTLKTAFGRNPPRRPSVRGTSIRRPVPNSKPNTVPENVAL